ncbi:hypothetical protein CL621_01125 [archaeon]|nr:hypothetical protein [archaeon]
MAETSREMHASQSSVEISINAKGLWSAKVKAYADTVDDAIKLAEQKAVELELKINSRNTIT